MADSFINVPSNIDDPTVLKRFLNELINKLNEIFGLSGTEKFITENSLKDKFQALYSILSDINNYMRKDKVNDIDYPISYKGSFTVDGNQLPQLNQVKREDNKVKSWASNTFVAKTTIEQLTQTISDPPTKTEVENIQNKVNEIIANLE